MDKLKILLPKGRIYDNVVELFNGAGISIKLPERAYRPTVNQDDLEAKVMKPQNIGKLLELGAHDVGFTGRDWIEETSADVEEIMDLAGVAHLSTIKSSVPFLHFFDGFRTSHEIQKVEVLDHEVLNGLLDRDCVKKFRDN